MRRRFIAWLPFHWGALLSVGAALLSLSILGGFVTDDAAITLRYARHLADGEGILWNAGEHPVEGYTNFSHVLLGAAAIKTGLPPLCSLRLINQACLLVLCLLVYALAFDVLRSRAWAAGCAVLVGLHAPLAYWASSGLETALYTASIYAGILAVRRLSSPRTLWPALWFLAAALSRLEGPTAFCVVAGCIALTALRARSVAPLRPHRLWMTVFVAVYAGYFTWRYHHFGYLLSNSAYFKLVDPSESHLIEQFARQNAPLLLLAPFADFRKLGTLGLIVVAITVAYVGGYYGVKDSIAYFHRFFLPVVPGLAVLAASALQRLSAPSRGGSLWPVLAVALFAAALGIDVFHPESGLAQVRAEGARLNTRIVSRAQVAALIAERALTRETVAVEDVGVIGFVLPNPIADLFGLNDERYTHVLASKEGAYVRSVMAHAPGFVVVVSWDPDRLKPRYAAGRIAVTTPKFGKHYVVVTVVRSPTERYHYFVFARRDLRRASAKRRLALPGNENPASMVDDLFRMARH
jgi:hypothetical protein